jgi:Mrp family chromosome partitioning ATPase/capsular polysaccharide biosynthesis protein
VNLADLLLLFRRHRVVAAVVALAVVALGAFAAFTPSDQYESNTTVLVNPKLTNGQAVSIDLVDFLVPTYLARLGTTRFQRAAVADLPASVRHAAVSVTNSSSAGTGIINIHTTSPQRDAVAPWAKALADHLIAKSSSDFTTLSLLDNPVTPDSPYAPSRTLIFVISLVVAFFAAIIAVILAESLGARRDGAAEIRERFGARVLAEIPIMSESLAVADPGDLADNVRAASVVDALQTLRANLSYLLLDRPQRWVVVTSVGKREGKSFVAVHLAWLLASLGESTLLLDADTRKSTAHKLLGLSPSPGISDLTPKNLHAVTQRTENEHLGYIGPGIPDRHPAEIASTHLPELLHQVDELGYTLIVDAPPMVGAAETSVYAALCGSVVLVIDARRRGFDDVEQTLLALRDRKVEVLGVVINRARGGRRRWWTPSFANRG